MLLTWIGTTDSKNFLDEETAKDLNAADQLEKQIRKDWNKAAIKGRVDKFTLSSTAKDKRKTEDWFDFSWANDLVKTEKVETKEPEKITEVKTEVKKQPQVKTSIVDLLKSKWFSDDEASRESRKKLADSYWIANYEWTKEQNAELIKKVSQADTKILAEKIRSWVASGTISSEDAKKWIEKIQKIKSTADEKAKTFLTADITWDSEDKSEDTEEK